MQGTISLIIPHNYCVEGNKNKEIIQKLVKGNSGVKSVIPIVEFKTILMMNWIYNISKGLISRGLRERWGGG